MAAINDSDNKEFLGLPWGKKKYTQEEIEKLLEDVKKFNAGAVDEPLSRHVDKVFAEWLETHK